MEKAFRPNITNLSLPAHRTGGPRPAKCKFLDSPLLPSLRDAAQTLP